MGQDLRAIAQSYFDCWKRKDFVALRALLADGCTFRGPMGTADGADACIQGLQGLAKMMEDVRIQAICAHGDDVITWYELCLKGAPPVPTANWSRVEDGKITAIRAAFDPRPILPPGK